jgi:hypothetical protein
LRYSAPRQPVSGQSVFLTLKKSATDTYLGQLWGADGAEAIRSTRV